MTALLPRDVAEELAERGRYATDGLRLEVTEERILVVCEDDIEGSFSLQAFQRLLHEADRRAA